MHDIPDRLTWRYLRDRINEMEPERLDDVVQILRNHNEGPVPLDFAVAFDTVAYYFEGMGDNCTRGSEDNAHHPEHYVLLTDGNPHNAYGDKCYRITEEGVIGSQTGRNYGPGPFHNVDAGWLIGNEEDRR